MTIVFNAPAIILLIIILIFRYLFGLILPTLDSFFHPYSWLIFYVVSGLGELLKLKGRIFWIPMWLIGFVGVIVSAFISLDSTEVFFVVSILISLYLIGYFILRRTTRLNWEKAKASLVRLKTNSSADKRNLFKSAFYVPSYINPENSLQYMVLERFYQKVYYKWMSNPDVNTHYAETLDLLKGFVSEQDYKSKIVVFRNSLDRITQNQRVSIDQYMFQNILELINKSTF